METTVATPAGAPESATTETVSATRAAADKGDVSTFLDADRAARSGKPLALVERPKPDAAGRTQAPGKDGAPAPGPSAADRAADERLRARVAEATAADKAEIRVLREQLARSGVPKPADTPAAPTGGPVTVPEYKRYLAMPDAPKLEDFESIPEHTAALGIFIADKREAERAEASRTGAAEYQRAKAAIDRATTFSNRIAEAKQADPTFGTALSKDVSEMYGFGRLQQINAERAKAGQPQIQPSVRHAIAELIYDSDVAPAVLTHLSTHPDALAELEKAPNPQQLAKAFGKLEDRIGAASTTQPQPATPAETRASAAAAVASSVSSAPPPAPTLGKPSAGADPIKAAIDKGDIGTFLELDRQARIQKAGRG